MAEDWQEIASTEIEQRDPLKMELWKKYANRDSANSERIADLKFEQGSTTLSTWQNLVSKKIRIHPYLQKLTIQGWLNISTPIGEEAIAHIRFECNGNYSTEDSIQAVTSGSKTFLVTFDLSSLSGSQTLVMQGKITVVSGGGPMTMKGQVLTEPSYNTRRYDSYWGQV